MAPASPSLDEIISYWSTTYPEDDDGCERTSQAEVPTTATGADDVLQQTEAPTPPTPVTGTADIGAPPHRIEIPTTTCKGTADVLETEVVDPQAEVKDETCQPEDDRAGQLSAEDVKAGWQAEGHEWIGSKVSRSCGVGSVTARVVQWKPENEKPALWRIRHDDGDEEELTRIETELALLLHEEQVEKRRRKRVRVTKHTVSYSDAEGADSEEWEDTDKENEDRGGSSGSEYEDEYGEKKRRGAYGRSFPGH